MIVVRTVEGNHMRQHREGGRSNQRELDVIAEEVMAEYCPGFAVADIGVTTPYRRQATKAADVLDQTEADTVHRFPGPAKAGGHPEHSPGRDLARPDQAAFGWTIRN